MKMYQLNDSNMLDNYILAKELMEKAGLSSNAFRYWKDTVACRYHKSRIVYLHKKFILPKYKRLANECTSLSGLVQTSSFCRYTSLPSSHLTASNGSEILSVIDIKFIEGIKFVNLKKFLEDFGLDSRTTIYIEKCKYFAPLEKKIVLTKNLCLGYY